MPKNQIKFNWRVFLAVAFGTTAAHGIKKLIGTDELITMVLTAVIALATYALLQYSKNTMRR